MRLKTLLSRSLLVAVGLLAGTSAWAATETWDFTNSTTWGSVTLPTTDVNSVSYNASGEAATTGNIVTFYSTTGAIAHANKATNGIAFSATGSTTDNYIKLTVPAGYAASVTAYVSSNRNVQVVFGNNSAETFSGNWVEITKDYDNTTGTTDLDLYIYCSANPGHDPANKKYNAPYLRKITLTNNFLVTTNYVDEDGNAIATAKSEYVEAGSYTPTYSQTVYVSDTDPYVYTYKEGGDVVTVNKATTINIVYTKSDRTTHKVTVTQSYGGKTSSTDNTVYDGATFTYYYPKFILDGTTLYQYSSSTDANADKSYWTSTLTNVTADAAYTLTYTAIDGECVYYSEGEDITDAARDTYAAFISRSSNGGAGVLSATTITTLDAGSYTVTARIIGRADRSCNIYQGSTSGTLISNCASNTTGKETTSNAFTLTEATAIVADGGYVSANGNGHGFDYIYIMKIADPTVTINADSKLASYSNDNVVTVPDDVTIYIATANDGSTVTLTKVDGLVIPAKTGVILYSTTTGARTLSYGGTAPTISSNLLTGTGSSTFTADDNTYALVAGEQAIAKVNSGVVIPANKAYIETSAGAKLNIVFGDTVTGIDSVQTTNGTNDTNAIYNLAGQRVSKSYKGVVVKGGKKFLQR